MKKFFKNKKSKAFTLIEFIVVITIASIIMTALIIQQGRWNNRLTVNTQAFELAMMIRQAQIYSLGVREDVGKSGDKFDVGYGININKNTLTNYIFFSDRNGNLRYNSGEQIETKTFSQGVTIEKFCGTGSGNVCSDTVASLRTLEILFLRPESNANIKFLNPGGVPINNINPPVTIYLRSAGNTTSSVKIESNGQISIQ